MNVVSEQPTEWVKEGVEVPRLVRYLTHGSATVFRNAAGTWTWHVEVPRQFSTASGVEPTQQRAKSMAILVYLTLTHRTTT